MRSQINTPFGKNVTSKDVMLQQIQTGRRSNTNRKNKFEVFNPKSNSNTNVNKKELYNPEFLK
jgi:hypothetical protein